MFNVKLTTEEAVFIRACCKQHIDTGISFDRKNQNLAQLEMVQGLAIKIAHAPVDTE